MNELFRIITGALRLDIQKVRNYTAFLAERLESGGDEDLALRLRKLLDESDVELRPARLNTPRVVPVDSESRFPLLEAIDLKSSKEPPILLTSEQSEVVQEFLSVAKCQTQIENSDISASLSFLMYGPPGSGKTRLARHIATQLELPLYVARLDGLISSFLGSTSKNIRALFEFASKTPCVLFLDEFDAIAKLRGDTQEMGELKRVVNSFVQNLDSVGQHSIVVAATNHSELLDSAVWRRFSYRVEFSYPSPEIRSIMWRQFLEPIEMSHKDIELLADLSDGFSGSDIQDACIRLHRRRIVSKKNPSLNNAFHALQNLAIGEGEERRFLSSFKGKENPAIVKGLRERNRKLYSYAAVAELLGVSKPTAVRWGKEGGDNNA